MAYFNLAKCGAKLRTEAQNNDLRHYFEIASTRSHSLSHSLRAASQGDGRPGGKRVALARFEFPDDAAHDGCDHGGDDRGHAPAESQAELQRTMLTQEVMTKAISA